MSNTVLWNNLVNADLVYKVALKVVQNGQDPNDIFMRLQGNTDGFPLRWNIDVGETFRDCTELHSSLDVLFNTRYFNSDKISLMERMFENCKNVGGNLDVNLINVRNMQNTFRNSGISAAPTVIMGNLHNIDNIFRDCNNLYVLPEIVSMSTAVHGDTEFNASSMCMGCSNLRSLPIDKITLSSSNGLNIDMSYAFAECYMMSGNLEEFLQSGTPREIGFNYVTNWAFAFRNCQNITGGTLNPYNSHFPYGNATDFTAMYEGCRNLTGTPIVPYGTTDRMFNGCLAMTYSPYILRNVFRLNDTFRDCHTITGSIALPYQLMNNAMNYNDMPTIAYYHLNGAFDNCFNLMGVAIKGKYSSFNSTTFRGWQNKKIWVGNVGDFNNIAANLAGLTFNNDTLTINHEQVRFIYNNHLSGLEENYYLNSEMRITDVVNNVVLYCYELPEPEPVLMNKLDFPNIVETYMRSQNAGITQDNLNNQVWNTDFYFGWNIPT